MRSLGFEPRRDATFVQPSVAAGDIASCKGVEQSATYFGPQVPAAGAMLVDSRSEHGRELGPFEAPCSPRQHCQRAPTSTQADPVPTTTSAQTTMTTYNSNLHGSDMHSCRWTSLCTVRWQFAPVGTDFRPSRASSCRVAVFRTFGVSPGRGLVQRPVLQSSETSRQSGGMHLPAVISNPSLIEVKS